MVDRVWIVKFRDGDGHYIHSVHASKRSAISVLRNIHAGNYESVIAENGLNLSCGADNYWVTEMRVEDRFGGEPTTAEEPTETPAHYKGDLVFQVIDAYDLGFYFGNVIKYVCRHKQKGGLDDLRKAKDYLDRETRKMEGMKE